MGIVVLVTPPLLHVTMQAQELLVIVLQVVDLDIYRVALDTILLRGPYQEVIVLHRALDQYLILVEQSISKNLDIESLMAITQQGRTDDTININTQLTFPPSFCSGGIVFYTLIFTLYMV